MKFEPKPDANNASNEELLDDLRRVVNASVGDVSRSIYDEDGKFASTIFGERFGGWAQALIAAGIKRSKVNNTADELLFQNLEEVWLKIGRQPKYDEVKAPLSQFSAAVYKSRFGTWMKALEKFAESHKLFPESHKLSESEPAIQDYVSKEGIYHTDIHIQKEPLPAVRELQSVNVPASRLSQMRSQSNNISRESQQEPLFESLKSVYDDHEIYEIHRRTNRSPNDRLRFKVLKRGNYKCVACGRSPAKDPNVELHIDHIIPWSKGGETVLENLQILCAECNLGKSNIE